MGRWIYAATTIGMLLAVSPDASAQIYKYKKRDGSVVYTDNLSQLPDDRRAYYNKLEQERERQRQEQIQKLGKEEFERREQEKKLEELKNQELNETERARREAEINAVLERIRERQKARDASQTTWQNKAAEARKKVADLLAEFNATQEKYQSLATRASFSLLPGQQQEMIDLKAKLDQLEKDLDLAIEYLEFTLPEEARRAGIPPGWIR
jgi:chromosome segregation ATPase